MSSRRFIARESVDCHNTLRSVVTHVADDLFAQRDKHCNDMGRTHLITSSSVSTYSAIIHPRYTCVDPAGLTRRKQKISFTLPRVEPQHFECHETITREAKQTEMQRRCKEEAKSR